MTDIELIGLLTDTTTTVPDVFPNLNDWKQLYRDYSKMIHTDKCSHPKAGDAISRLNGLRDTITKGEPHKDDAGDVRFYQGGSVEITGEPNILKHSLNNWTWLMNAQGKIGDELRKRIPIRGEIKDGMLTFKLPGRALPLSYLIKKQGAMELKHVNWILSRMLEFGSLINGLGYTHAGITPDSIYIDPVTHGIYCISFYHMTKLGQKVGTISSRYKGFYPAKLFREKVAIEQIDIDLCKRTAIYLLGDSSGNGSKLRGKIPADLLQYLMKVDTKSFDSYKEWRAILTKNFQPQFHILKV